MDRRDTLKSLLIGSFAAGTVLQTGCNPKNIEEEAIQDRSTLYGRTPEEKERDEKLLSAESVFTQDELETIAILCDIILPASPIAGSAVDAEVPAFIDFMAKDIPAHQIPLKGGLMWLNSEANNRFSKIFKDLTRDRQIEIVEDIAYPETASVSMKPGVAFFNRMRNLTLTGYYTSKMGIEELGYKGNMANIWDGVPNEVLKKYNVDYDKEWLEKCVDQNKRNDTAVWDKNGNLLS